MSRKAPGCPYPAVSASTAAAAEANGVTLTHSKLEELPGAVHRRERRQRKRPAKRGREEKSEGKARVKYEYLPPGLIRSTFYVFSYFAGDGNMI